MKSLTATGILLLPMILLLVCTHSTAKARNKFNNRPIIGVPSMAITDSYVKKNIPSLNGKSFIPASYIKYLEMAGARVVPIERDLSDEELRKIFSSINGALFIGGEANLEYSGYYLTTKRLFQLAESANDANDYFPILGVCRGMQAMLVHVLGGDISRLTLTDARAYPASLKWISTDSKILTDIPDDIMEIISKENLTYHFHKYGVTPKDFHESRQLDEMFEILATSVDRDGKEFVSIYQGRVKPYYGLQFHPEKPIFEFGPSAPVPHTRESIRFSQQLVNNFIDHTRKNKHKFESYKEEMNYTIARKQPLYTGFLVDSLSPFEQIYVFN